MLRSDGAEGNFNGQDDDIMIVPVTVVIKTEITVLGFIPHTGRMVEIDVIDLVVFTQKVEVGNAGESLAIAESDRATTP